MTVRPISATLLAALFLGACQTSLPAMMEPEAAVTRDVMPPGAQPGTCWGRDVTPAVIETVTNQIILQPAEVLNDGTIAEPAIYKTETHQQIVKQRKETWFETPCDQELTPEFIATVQRALKARGHYRGPITGRMDGRTRAAIRAYQKPQGLDSGVLSLAAARQMGLVTVRSPGNESIETAALELPPAETNSTLESIEAEEDAREAEFARADERARAAEAARAEEDEREAEIARAEEAAKAAEIARAEAAAREVEAARVAEAARAEKAKRAAELEAALEAERAAKKVKPKSLPISDESY